MELKIRIKATSWGMLRDALYSLGGSIEMQHIPSGLLCCTGPQGRSETEVEISEPPTDKELQLVSKDEIAAARLKYVWSKD